MSDLQRTFELVVPAYNESKNLELLVDRAIEAAMGADYSSHEFNLVLINNGSTDDTGDVLSRLQKSPKGEWFRIVHVAKNCGYGFGLWQGILSVKAKYVAWSHADLQCDPKDAFAGLKVLQQSSGKVLVKGRRSGRDSKDKMVSRVFEAFARLILGLKIYEMNAQPKVFERSLLPLVKNPPVTFAFDLYILYIAQKAGYQVKTIEVLFPPRIHGASNWASNFLGRYKTIFGIIKYMFDLAFKEGRL